ASRYTGAFSNEWLGTLRVDDRPGALSMELGSMHLELEPAAAGKDEFELHELMEAKTPGRFVRDDHGGTEAVPPQPPPHGDIGFRRGGAIAGGHARRGAAPARPSWSQDDDFPRCLERPRLQADEVHTTRDRNALGVKPVPRERVAARFARAAPQHTQPSAHD